MIDLIVWLINKIASCIKENNQVKPHPSRSMRSPSPQTARADIKEKGGLKIICDVDRLKQRLADQKKKLDIKNKQKEEKKANSRNRQK